MNKIVLDDINYLNNPYPHCIIDNFFDAKTADVLHENILSLNLDNADTKFVQKSKHEYNKYTFNKIENQPVQLRDVFMYLNSKEFISQIEKLTGISHIVHGDFKLRGAGIHIIKKGGYLNMHTDFNSYKTEKHGKLYRRLNLLVYMNKDWKSEYKGDLLMYHPKDMTNVKRIQPIFNRGVIFNTTDESIHGHPEILNVPNSDIYRKSIAVYYYTKSKNEFESEVPHSTIWHTTPKKMCKHDENLIIVFFSMTLNIKKEFIHKMFTNMSSSYECLWNPDLDDLNSRKHIVIIYGNLHGMQTIIAHCEKNSINYLYIDNSYSPNVRKQYHSVSLNGPQNLFNITNESCNVFKIEKQFDPEGKYVLIAPPEQNYMADLMNSDASNYLKTTIANIQKYTDLPIKIRFKEISKFKQNKNKRYILIKYLKNIPNVTISKDSVEEDIKNCVVLCTSFSRIAIDALTLGKPIICDECAFAYEVSQRFDSLKYGMTYDAEKMKTFVSKVNNSQFSYENIINGKFYDFLLPHIRNNIQGKNQ